MGKRIVLFMAANLAIVLTISLLVTILGAVGFAVGPARLPLLWIAVASLAWGVGGALLSLGLSRWFAKKALGVRLVDGKTGESDADWLYASVQRLTQKTDLPMPEVGVYESAEVNAFSAGPTRRRSLVAVSTGLLQNMSRQEAAAALGHEVTHIANGDMVTMALLQGVVNAFVLFFARTVASLVRRKAHHRVAAAVAFVMRIVLDVVLGLLGAMIVAQFSRRREFRADAGAAALGRREDILSALRQLARTSERIDGTHPALASFKIAGSAAWLDLLATHPPLAERIARLERAAAAPSASR
jgi:heat shock protein HtpX